MGKTIEYKKGEIVGDCIYLNDVLSKPGNRKALFKCKYCGNTFEAFLSNVRRFHTTSCGCMKFRFPTTHNLSRTKLHATWRVMKQRCYNTKNKSFVKYGGRGIQICDEWLNDFKVYNDYIMALPNAFKEGYSIDRVENDGDYEPGNIRWTTGHIQTTNRRMNKNNTSGYTGVSYNKFRRKWTSGITLNWEAINIGAYDTLKESVEARNKYIIDNGLAEYKIQEFNNTENHE